MDGYLDSRGCDTILMHKLTKKMTALVMSHVFVIVPVPRRQRGYSTSEFCEQHM